MSKFFKILNSTRGGGATILLVFFVSAIFVTLIGTYQKAINNYQKRHFQLKENYQLLEATESLSVLVRQAFDVARMSPKIGGVPQCPLPEGGTANAESRCFKTGTGCLSVSDYTYFCWADVTNPATRCIEGPSGKKYCFGSNAGDGDRDDILPVQVSYSQEAEAMAKNEVKDLFKSHWSDWLGPIPNLILNSEIKNSNLILNAAQADTAIAYTTQTTLMNTTSCVTENEFCKNCLVENGCIRISICPVYLTDSECQARPNERFLQYVLFTN